MWVDTTSYLIVHLLSSHKISSSFNGKLSFSNGGWKFKIRLTYQEHIIKRRMRGGGWLIRALRTTSFPLCEHDSGSTTDISVHKKPHCANNSKHRTNALPYTNRLSPTGVKDFSRNFSVDVASREHCEGWVRDCIGEINMYNCIYRQV